MGYDNLGRLISEHGYSSDDGNYAKTYSYNDLGQLSSAKLTNLVGETRYSYFYDDDGKLTETKEVIGIIERIITYRYNDLGQRTKRYFKHDTYFETIDTTDYYYNNSGQLIRSVETSDSGSQYTTRYIYNSSGRLSETRYPDVGATCLWIHNSAGQLTKLQCALDSNQQVLSYTNYHYESATCTSLYDPDGVDELVFGTSVCKP